MNEYESLKVSQVMLQYLREDILTVIFVNKFELRCVHAQ